MMANRMLAIMMMANQHQMRASMFLQVIATSEAFATRVACVRSDAGVDAFVSGQLFVARKRFAALIDVAVERPFAGVNADVALQLPVVGESHTTVRTNEAFGPLFAGVQLFGARLFGKDAPVGVLYFAGGCKISNRSCTAAMTMTGGSRYTWQR